MDTGITDKTALITGASRGIGRAIFCALGAAGARVIGTATSEVGAKQITQAAADFSGQGLVFRAGEDGATEQLMNTVESEFGGADIVVANAAINADGLIMRMKPEDWERVIDVNLTSVFRLTQSALKTMMKKRQGRIIAVSSVVASIGNPGQANYCAAKAGLEAYLRVLAREAAARGITVNAVAPGFIATDMTDQLPDKVKEYFLANIPLARAGSADEVAQAVRFLASDAASYITGQVLHINGGLYMN